MLPMGSFSVIPDIASLRSTTASWFPMSCATDNEAFRARLRPNIDSVVTAASLRPLPMTSLQPGPEKDDESSLDRVVTCRNCGAPAPGQFCPECGHETARELRTVAQFLAGLFAQYAAREGRLWQTLSK